MMTLALTVFSLSASSITAGPPETIEPLRISLVCTKSTQKTSGLTKICYYHCGGSEGAMTAKPFESCPHRILRWRLNRNAAFGPSANAQ
jgi:hypothetical protein